MKKALLVLTIITGILAALLFYERLAVESTIGPSAILSLAIVASVFLAFLVSFLLYDTRHREVLLRIWMVLISTSVSYFLLDLIAGFLLIKPISPDLVPDEYRHHKLVANSSSRVEQREFAYLQRVNNFGIRGEDLPAQKPANSYRIVMLGDSFTMGKGVKDDETFSVLLDAALGEKIAACGGRHVDVLNAGVDSYAPVLELIQVKRELPALQPDMIIVNLDVSDLVQEARYRSLAVKGADGEIVGVPGHPEERVSLTDKARSWIEHRLFFTRALLVYTNKIFGYGDLGGPDVLTQATSEITDHTLMRDTVSRELQWENIFDSLKKIKAHSDSAGIEFFLSVYPWPHQFSDSAWVPGRYTFMPKDAPLSDKSVNTIQRLAALNNIQVLDAYPAFRTHAPTEPLYYKYDMHWTAAGHRVMAKSLEDLLMARFQKSWCG